MERASAANNQIHVFQLCCIFLEAKSEQVVSTLLHISESIVGALLHISGSKVGASGLTSGNRIFREHFSVHESPISFPQLR